MSKGLEALKEMYDEAVSSICRYVPRQAHKEVAEYFDERKSIIEKELKALEIIKPFLNKIIGINRYDKDFFECFIQIGNDRKFIPEEEYKMLKEVLKDD